MSLRCPVCLICVMTAFVAGTPGNVSAQAAPIARAAISAGVGVAEGAVVTLAIAAARARFQEEYVESASDMLALSWRTAPMIVAPVAGVVYGLAGEDPFIGSLIGSASGFVIGATVGGLIGRFTSDSSESTWAGAIIGAGAGLTVGRLLVGVLKWNGDGDSEPRSMSVAVRIAI